MTTTGKIEEFLALRRVALVGVSRNPGDFSRSLFHDMCERGYDLVPVNPTTGKDTWLTGVNNDRPNVVLNQNTYTGAPHGKFYQYVNPKLYTANAPAAPGPFGNAGHYSLRGPGYFDIDVAVTREFHLKERVRLHARGEAFNVLNHPNFGLPNGNIASAAFGQITTAFDPRILQGSVKLVF